MSEPTAPEKKWNGMVDELAVLRQQSNDWQSTCTELESSKAEAEQSLPDSFRFGDPKAPLGYANKIAEANRLLPIYSPMRDLFAAKIRTHIEAMRAFAEANGVPPELVATFQKCTHPFTPAQ